VHGALPVRDICIAGQLCTCYIKHARFGMDLIKIPGFTGSHTDARAQNRHDTASLLQTTAGSVTIAQAHSWKTSRQHAQQMS